MARTGRFAARDLGQKRAIGPRDPKYQRILSEFRRIAKEDQLVARGRNPIEVDGKKYLVSGGKVWKYPEN